LAQPAADKDRTWHMLRHPYASVLIDGGESVTVVARRLGHANPSETLRTYSHLWPDSDDRTRQVVEAAFGHSRQTEPGQRKSVESLRDG
jgi:site-specific recombinase XerD